MREEGLKAIQPRSFVPRTTDSRQTRKPSPNLLLEREMPAREPNQVLVGDITYVPLGGGKWAYLATWLDLFARKLVGWHLDTHMRAEIVLKALEKAEGRRSLGKGTIVHSDLGSQYASAKFRKHLAKKGYQQSMSRKADCYDNVFAESFFSRLKSELLQDGIFDTFEDAFTEIFNYIECYYNSKRRHSALGYLCPDKFEELYFSNLTVCP
jgi:transposase InsO family protein